MSPFVDLIAGWNDRRRILWSGKRIEIIIDFITENLFLYIDKYTKKIFKITKILTIYFTHIESQVFAQHCCHICLYMKNTLTKPIAQAINSRYIIL